MELAGQNVCTLPVPLTLQAFAQREGDCASHGLARQSSQVTSEQASLGVLDVESHRQSAGRTTRFILPAPGRPHLQCPCAARVLRHGSDIPVFRRFQHFRWIMFLLRWARAGSKGCTRGTSFLRRRKSAGLAMPRARNSRAAARRLVAPESSFRRMWTGRAGPDGRSRRPTGAEHEPWGICGGAACWKAWAGAAREAARQPSRAEASQRRPPSRRQGTMGLRQQLVLVWRAGAQVAEGGGFAAGLVASLSQGRHSRRVRNRTNGLLANGLRTPSPIAPCRQEHLDIVR